MRNDVMVFTLDEQRIALPLPGVAQLIRSAVVTPLPQAPANVLGVISVQGESVPVLNLRQLLGLPERGIGPDAQFIIMITGRRRLALVVDEVKGVMDFPEQDLTAAEPILPGLAFVKGAVRTRDGTILIKNPDLFLSFSDERLSDESIPSPVKTPEPPTPAQTGFDVMVFTLMNEHYGIETAHVREVYPAMEVTPIPCTPHFVAGVINVRGDIIAVINLKTYFELPVSESSSSGEVIIVEAGDSLFGVLADSTLGVSFVSLADFQAPLPDLSGIRAESLRGGTKDQMFLLDIPRMLADKKLWVHEEVAL
jgi:purine-binding chemotaxis protein CheW